LGQQHLTRALAVGVALAGAACSPGPHEAASPNVAVAHTRHAQIVPAMKSEARLELVKRFVERNGPDWTINREGLLGSTTIVDPFVGFLRRASRVTHPGAGAGVAEEDATAAARAFVRKNADLLGIPASKLLILQATARPFKPWAVKLEASYPKKGYESFEELTNEIAIELFVDESGTVNDFVNHSKLHPPLAIDTTPGLGDTDWRVYAQIVGRRVFAMSETGRRIELGKIERMHLMNAKLAMQVSPGPLNAYLMYRLAWRVTVFHEVPDAPGVYFLFDLVDTDTGEVVRDSPVPTEAVDLPP
jgi:hypothetical protein